MSEPTTLTELLAGALAEHDGAVLRLRTEYRTHETKYGDLDDASRRGVALLAALGLRPGDAAIIWGANGPAWVTALLALFRSGVVAVPLDARSRPEFVARVAAATDSRLLIHSRGLTVESPGIATIELESLFERLAEYEPAAPRAANPADVAEIVYTSGTTGEPKGVILTHGNLATEIAMLRPVVGEMEIRELKLLSVLPLSHVLEQVVGLLLPLSVGATVVYLARVTPLSIARALHSERITAMIVVPRVLELLASGIRRASPVAGLPDRLAAIGLRLPERARRLISRPLRRAFAPALRYLACGGATLDPSLERFWDGLGITVVQGYGLTETSSAITFNRPSRPVVGCVGIPLPGVEVAIGESGEILARGANVTPGYYSNPTATAAAIGDGWLRTGDVGGFDALGYLHLRGRLKEIIVTAAGANVYPEDVEEALRSEPEVRDCAAIEREARVHVVLLLADPSASAAAIVERANRHLDTAQQILGYDVWPGADLPRTATGKVSRRMVAEAIASASAGARPAARERPADPLASLLADVGRVPPDAARPDVTLGPDLHLTSLDRLELVARIEGELGIIVDESAVSAETRVADLRRLVEHGERTARQPAGPRWQASGFARVFRHAFQRGALFPYLRRSISLEVRGREHLSGIRPPVIFAANHTSRLDVPAILMALPESWRERCVPLARAEYFEAPEKPLQALWLSFLRALVALGFDALPLPQYRGFRESLRQAGERVDRGHSLVFFPEGQQTLTHGMGEFRAGIGLLATALDLPVVPVRLRGLVDIARGAELVPRRSGHATISFGGPLRFRDESYPEIASAVEEAVRRL